MESVILSGSRRCESAGEARHRWLSIRPGALQAIRALGWALLFGAAAAGAAAQGAGEWAPRRGQPGKDVMWLPTSDELTSRLLEVARVGPEDLVYDLGAGDGKIAIAAAAKYGARSVGIEYNAQLAEHARRNVERAGLAHRVSIRQGDLFQTDFSSATVLTLYLLEELNHQLRPTILAMRPGTRVVSNSFAMGDWEPDQVIRVGTQVGYYWKVPARVQGRWRLDGIEESGASALLELVQRHQRLAGTIAIGGRSQPLLSPEIDGTRVMLRYVDSGGLLKALALTVRGEGLEGEVVPPYGMVENPGEPVRVRARRVQSGG
jgi:protein-L-isoaspartate O-methyltransferase